MAECEGFICPLCMRDFRGVVQLEQHFQEDHSDTTQSRFRSNLKNLFGKLRRKNQDGGLVDEGAAAASSRVGGAEGVVTNISGINPECWEPQQFGSSRNLMGRFRRERDTRTTQLAAETNRLIIRVERLFKALQVTTLRTPKARKELEQSVVSWRPDKEAKRCQYCGRGFNIRRRKHHCRLCGGIICHRCSQFMSLSETYPVLSDCPDFHSLAPPTKTRLLSLKRGRGERDEEEDEKDQTRDLRMCSSCHRLIHRRLLQLQNLEKPLVSALYERMQQVISDADARKPPYLLMAESIIAGEHGYRLHDAMRTRQQLIKLYEAIDSISKDVFSLGSGAESDLSVSRATFKLCRGVRVFASTYLQENLLSLPSLPTSQQLAEIRQRKEEEARERLRELERQRELLRREELARGPVNTVGTGGAVDDTFEEEERGFAGASASFSADLVPGEKKKRFEKLKNFSTKVMPKVNFKREGGGGEEGSVRVERLESGSGWMSTSKAFGSIDSQDDPFTLQREQLVGFIEQAQAAGRSDEVAALQQSLQEIERLMAEREQLPRPSMSYGFT